MGDCESRADAIPVAFYAPLKSPNHPTPSGDQRLARLFIRALESAGFAVQLVSDFRSFSATPPDRSERRAQRLQARGEQRRLLAHWQAHPELKPRIWFSYHLYHKAPDLLGPGLSRLLGIPYLVAEASWAPKRLNGPWHWGMRQVAKALRRACQVIAINPCDQPCVDRFRQQLGRPVSTYIAPFIEQRSVTVDRRGATQAMLAQEYDLPLDRPWLLSVAMLRPGDKLASYRMLANALGTLKQRFDNDHWHWLIVGSGRAQPTFESELAHLQGHYSFLGLQDAEQVFSWMRSADLLVWPGINEALGMVFLEAASVGLPIMAGSSPGVASVCPDTAHLIENIDSERLARALDQWLKQPADFVPAAQGRFDRAVEQLRVLLADALQQVGPGNGQAPDLLITGFDQLREDENG